MPARAGDAEMLAGLPAPGQLVDVGGYRLHIYCIGDGGPVVVLDSGVGGFSLEWIRIQQALAHEVRICAYDRAGYGWSDMGPLPRTSQRIADELHALLHNTDLPTPYILAGHSFGGYTVQYFASHYPDEVAALLLIDSSHPEQLARLPQDRERRLLRHRFGHSRQYLLQEPALPPHFPPEKSVIAQRLMRTWKSMLTWREESLNFGLSAAQVHRSGRPPDVPLIVLTRGLRLWPPTEYGNAMESAWMELQDELSLLTAHSAHLIAERSGHSIHLDQPEMVISAVRTLVDQARLENFRVTDRAEDCGPPAGLC
jgi:pimeloyl-ACP methyl ester carboxylesterase